LKPKVIGTACCRLERAGIGVERCFLESFSVAAIARLRSFSIRSRDDLICRMVLRAIYQEGQRDNPNAITFPPEGIPEMQVVASSPGSGKSTSAKAFMLAVSSSVDVGARRGQSGARKTAALHSGRA
jgi:hypothetical protein